MADTDNSCVVSFFALEDRKSQVAAQNSVELPEAPYSLPALSKDVLSSCIGREQQLKMLLSLFGEPSMPSLPAAFVYGPHATGKTYTIQLLLKKAKVHHAVVDCIEAYALKVLFSSILSKLQGRKIELAGHTWKTPRCADMAEFVSSLANILRQRDRPADTAYIVFDNADRLRSFKSPVLPALLRLGELTGCPICVIFMSTIVWEKFTGGTGLLTPMLICFESYDKAATTAIVSQSKPPDVPEELFRRFVDLLWDVFHGPCRDISELRHLVALLLPVYLAPIREGRLTAEQPAALYKHILPVLKTHLSRLFLRTTSSAEWLRLHQPATTTTQQTTQGAHSLQDASVCHTLELPFHAKYLLLAAFLASANPPRCDERIFARRQKRGKKARKTRGGAKVPQESFVFKGPKSFPIERLLAIFYSIHEGLITSSAEILSQVKTLTTFRLLSMTSGQDSLDAPRVKCLISHSEALQVASSVGFELNAFIYEG